jgi:hypothetical protein
MHSRTLSALLALCAALPIGAQMIPRDSEFHVKLLAPIDTKTSRKDDKITAQVLTPVAFKGDILEGRIDEAKNGGKVKGKAVLHFTFQSLNHAGGAIPVQSSVKSVTNSKGKQDVDEEGQIIRKKNNLGKAAVGTGVGALIGGIAGGAKGAAIGAGVGAAASIVFIEVAVSGANVSFAPGSQFLLNVNQLQ